MAVWGGLTNSCEKKRSKKQRRKGKIYPFECRVPKIARRDKKAFLMDQCEEIEENNRMGKTKEVFKKIRDTKGTFHEKMGTIKDRNGMDVTEAEDIKKRWQEYTEELYKKDLHDSDNHVGVITHLEPDILECEVKWAFEIKCRGTRDQIVKICWIMEKARKFQKNIYFCFIYYTGSFDCMDHNKL